MVRPDQKLSGDVAHELFTSSLPFPLHDLLEAWKSGEQRGEAGYILAIIRAFDHMTNHHDGARDGTYRPVAAKMAAFNAARYVR